MRTPIQRTWLPALAAGALLLSACGDAGQAEFEETAQEQRAPEETEEPVEGQEGTEGEPEDAEDDAAQEQDEDGAGSVLRVDPSCVEIGGDSFSISAEGLDPAQDYAVGYDPHPAPGRLEDGAPLWVQDDGTREVSAVIPDGVDAEPGRYVVFLVERGSEDRLDETAIEIAESC